MNKQPSFGAMEDVSLNSNSGGEQPEVDDDDGLSTIVKKYSLHDDAYWKIDLDFLDVPKVNHKISPTSSVGSFSAETDPTQKRLVHLWCWFWAAFVVTSAWTSATLVYTVIYSQNSSPNQVVNYSLLPYNSELSVSNHKSHTNFQVILENLISTIGPLNSWQGFRNKSSPQFKAMEWILYKDPMKIVEKYSAQNASSSTHYGSFRLHVIQRFVLASLFYATGGEEWMNNSFWLSETNECNWTGIRCDSYRSFPHETSQSSSSSEENAVTHVHLSNNNLYGMIPQDISAMRHLRFFIVSENSLTGTIPSWLANLESLDELRLEYNKFSGEVPAGLCQLELQSLTTDCASNGSITCSCCTQCFSNAL